MIFLDVSPICLQELASALREIRYSTFQSMPIQPCINSLRLAGFPAFGSKWLLPRLKIFCFAHPGMTLHLYFMPHVEALDFNATEVDAAIYVGVGGRHVLAIDLLKAEELVVIASPLLNNAQHVHSEQRIAKELLLDVSDKSQVWCEWFSYYSLAYCSMHIGPAISYLIRAVIEGVGIGLAPRILVEEKLLREDLVGWGESLTTYNNFYLIYPKCNERMPSLIAFRDW